MLEMSALNHTRKSCQNTAIGAADRVLWKKFKAGDRQAFSGIYHKYIHVLYFYGLNISGHTALTEDCIQELFIYLWDNRERLGETDNIKYYLLKSLRRKVLLDIKTYKKKKLKESENLRETADPSCEHRLIFDETKSAEKVLLDRAIQTLSKRQREAIRLRFYENLSFKEVAGCMSLTIKSTYNLVSRALDVLRGQLHYFPISLLLFSLF